MGKWTVWSVVETISGGKSMYWFLTEKEAREFASKKTYNDRIKRGPVVRRDVDMTKAILAQYADLTSGDVAGLANSIGFWTEEGRI